MQPSESKLINLQLKITLSHCEKDTERNFFISFTCKFQISGLALVFFRTSVEQHEPVSFFPPHPFQFFNGSK